MKNRNNKVIFVSLTAVAVVVLSVIMMLSTIKPHKIKNEPIIASQLTLENYLEKDTNETDTFVRELAEKSSFNEINTVILNINKGQTSNLPIENFEYIFAENEKLKDTDLLHDIKKSLNKKDIQLFVLIDCENLDYNQILNAVKYINMKKSVSSVVLDNFAGTDEEIKNIRKELRKGFFKVNLILKTEEIEKYKDLKTIDAFIAENINKEEYLQLKDNLKQDIYLHYENIGMNGDVFDLANNFEIDGAVVSDDINDVSSIVYKKLFDDKLDILNLEMNLSEEFKITYPTKDIATYDNTIFITGTGAEGEIVYANGKEYPVAPDGSFGIFTELEEGNNPITIKRKNGEKTVNIEKKVYVWTGKPSQPPKSPFGDQYALEYGRIVKSVQPLTSILSDPLDDSAIIGAVEEDTLMKIVGSELIEIKGHPTYAYKLSNGGYILSHKVELTNFVSKDYVIPEKELENGLNLDIMDAEILDDLVISSCDKYESNEKDEILSFSINRKPVVFTKLSDEKLELLILDASANGISIPEGKLYKSSIITDTDNGINISFELDEENKLWGYDVSYTDGQLQIYLKSSPEIKDNKNPLDGVKIVLDAGHGGKDTGALGVAGLDGPNEKDLNLAIALATESLLKQYGAEVVMIRNDDTFLTLEERREIPKAEKADFFISIHHNSMGNSYNNSKVRGSEAYYFTHQSEEFANLLCENISSATNRKNRGAHNDYYYVTRNDICPSVLMEYSFMVNPMEFANSHTNDGIYRAAFGTVQAILKAIPTKNEI